jgi:phosphoglycolate phosphatase-like HAD superfamily hydrolase
MDAQTSIKAYFDAGPKPVAILLGIFSREELESEKADLILENVNRLPDFVDSLLE